MRGTGGGGFEQTRQGREGEAVKVTLHDCLACSGCVTTAETVMLEQQSAHHMLHHLPHPGAHADSAGQTGQGGDGGQGGEGRKVVVVSLSPQSRAALAAHYKITPLQVRLTYGHTHGWSTHAQAWIGEREGEGGDFRKLTMFLHALGMAALFDTSVSHGKLLCRIARSPHLHACLIRYIPPRSLTSPRQAFRKLTSFLHSLGVAAVFDTSASRDVTLIEACHEFVCAFRRHATAHATTALASAPAGTMNGSVSGQAAMPHASSDHRAAAGATPSTPSDMVPTAGSAAATEAAAAAAAAAARESSAEAAQESGQSAPPNATPPPIPTDSLPHLPVLASACPGTTRGTARLIAGSCALMILPMRPPMRPPMRLPMRPPMCPPMCTNLCTNLCMPLPTALPSLPIRISVRASMGGQGGCAT
ncbi:unnamed protein product [Closterium sp. NIES-54]